MCMNMIRNASAKPIMCMKREGRPKCGELGERIVLYAFESPPSLPSSGGVPSRLPVPVVLASSRAHAIVHACNHRITPARAS